MDAAEALDFANLEGGIMPDENEMDPAEQPEKPPLENILNSIDLYTEGLCVTDTRYGKRSATPLRPQHFPSLLSNFHHPRPPLSSSPSFNNNADGRPPSCSST